MNYFEFYVGDYARDTTHLTLVEHGAYLMLMASYYGGEKPLPNDLQTLFRIARAMTPAEQRAVRSVADQFFPVSEDGMRHNARADELICKAFARIEAARENGKRGGRPKKSKTQRVTQRDTQQEPTGVPSTKAHQTPSFKAVSSNEETAPRGGAVCPQKAIIALYHEILPELPPVNDWPDASAVSLRNLWRKSAKRQTLDFWRTLFEHVRTSPFLMGEKTDFQASLVWLVKPTNFAKVVNGNYDNRERA